MTNKIDFQKVTVKQLGEEHIKNVVSRRGIQGQTLVSWCKQLVEWPMQSSAEGEEISDELEDNMWYSNGGCALDVNDDGNDEIIIARCIPRKDGEDLEDKPLSYELVWFEETQEEEKWKEHIVSEFPIRMRYSFAHDIEPFFAELPSGDTVRGVVSVLFRRTLVWFEIPENPEDPWIKHDIGRLGAENQSGIAVGNITDSPVPDVVCGMFWAESPEDPTKESWTIRRYGEFDKEKRFGGMTKAKLGDIDGDGLNELVISEAEIPEARIAVFKPELQDKDTLWDYELVAEKLYAPHSLVLEDIDGDGSLDIITGEMTAGGWDFPMHDNPRIIAYLNEGDLQFNENVLLEGDGIHEMGATTDENGRLILYGADEIQMQKFSGMNTDIFYLKYGGRDAHIYKKAS